MTDALPEPALPLIAAQADHAFSAILDGTVSDEAIAAFLIARYFGLREYGRLFGVHQGLNTVASALAPLLFAALFSYTASYTAMLSYCFVCSLVGPALLLTLGRDPGFGGVVALAGRS